MHMNLPAAERSHGRIKTKAAYGGIRLSLGHASAGRQKADGQQDHDGHAPVKIYAITPA